jgi:hypothetical protein
MAWKFGTEVDLLFGELVCGLLYISLFFFSISHLTFKSEMRASILAPTLPPSSPSCFSLTCSKMALYRSWSRCLNFSSS